MQYPHYKLLPKSNSQIIPTDLFIIKELQKPSLKVQVHNRFEMYLKGFPI